MGLLPGSAFPELIPNGNIPLKGLFTLRFQTGIRENTLWEHRPKPRGLGVQLFWGERRPFFRERADNPFFEEKRLLRPLYWGKGIFLPAHSPLSTAEESSPC